MPEPLIFAPEDESLLVAFGALAASTIEKNIVFQELQKILDDTNSAKVNLARTLDSIPTVVITLEKTGKLVNISHPEYVNISPDAVQQMKCNSFDMWLENTNNAQLIADIRKVFKGQQETICGLDYDLVLNKRTYIANYMITEMVASDLSPSGIGKAATNGDGSVLDEEDDVEENEEENDDNDNDYDELVGENEYGSNEETDDDGGDDNQSDLSKELKKLSTTTRKKRRMTRVQEVVIQFELIDTDKRISNTLAKYLPHKKVQSIMEEEENGTVDGKKTKASCMSVDLRNFLSICENTTASDVLFILSMYHTSVNNCVTENNGIVDKIVNQKATSVFGLPAPTTDNTDSYNAINAAMKLNGSLESLNDRLRECNLPMVQMGIGISTGFIISGIVGPPKRLEYLMIGDSIDLAAHIQGATKLYGCNLLICGKTQREVRDRFHFREIDTVVVKGSVVPVTLFEVLGSSSIELAREIITATICFELGLSEYRNQNYSVAQLHFKKAIQTSDDGPSKMFVKRCQDLLEGKLKMAPDWDGCWILQNN
ncbi:hypothetical protein HK100_012550 [Physocladia obscura]|uniref:Guanylate cyclase domain-containing protein n=1 Tax=Physocladia obscura TaxID=109957 RepID=A0AAD5XHJ6_9FUNG|nr:hypothetical protein HK100_012550 [Physocladia obscura]